MRFIHLLLVSMFTFSLACAPGGDCECTSLRDVLEAIFGGGDVDPDSLPPGINPLEPAGDPVPELGESVSLLVISECSVDANVLIRFFVDDVEVRRTVFLVPSRQTMNPVGPDRATRIVVSGTYVGDGPTPDAEYLLGQDFTEGDVEVYIIPEPADACPDDSEKVLPGQCGCGVADTDSDGDGTADCVDTCPQDAGKTSPGLCGCGVADTDSDGDGTADCTDACPQDPGKTLPGLCGCGVADTDSDSDGTADCNDDCPQDAGKTAPGVCGCGVADTDLDGDGTADCTDACPQDPNKTLPGLCGCGVADADSDGDGTADCSDGCPEDAGKQSPGLCGCGVADTDSDGDESPDCQDGCPADVNKVNPGICGCGVADTDTDEDSIPDCNDQCPDSPDTDSDGDGTLDCQDLCPFDSAKVAPGVCGCGVADTDTDGDGTPDCDDLCPTDADKTEPGECDCGAPDTDTDEDGTADCNDLCPTDPEKDTPEICGCGIADTDGDEDGVPDCNDACPELPNDLDSDEDGTPDCFDGCPDDHLKTAPGACGCGVLDTDIDSDNVPDCNDLCPNTIPNLEVDATGCPAHPVRVDEDRDGDVDLYDFGAIQACRGGEGVSVPPECEIFLLDGDDDIDSVDLALFVRCFSGADVAADPACRDCNGNGADDRDDLLACDAQPACSDCNGNGLPDSCDIAAETSLDVDANAVPDECQNPNPGTIRYVDSFSEGGDGRSWVTAYTTLQDALTEAATTPGSVSQIWVAQGTYRPDSAGNRSASFVLTEGVSVYGGFEGASSIQYPGGETAVEQRNPAQHPTVLSGDIGAVGVATDNSYHVITAVNLASSVLDGFVIRDGYADGAFENSLGAGALLLAANVQINNCVIQSNYAAYGGGLYNAGGSPSVVNCAFMLNQAQAADGAGGAMYSFKGRPTFTNCSLAGNHAAAVAGGLYFYQVSLATVTNCILWGNTAAAATLQAQQIAAVQGTTLSINYSCLQGWTGSLGGVGNIGFDLVSHDPRFVLNPSLPANPGDLRLGLGSPCVDAGNNAADVDAATAGVQALPALDLAWLPRLVDDLYPDTGAGTPPIVDMGAYELQPVP